MVLHIICDVFFLVGLIFALAGTLGILKMPDTFSRMQASTCVSTLGILGVCIGGVIYAAAGMHSASAAVKIAVIGLLVLVTNPIGSHVLARGAYKAGIRPETPLAPDALAADFGPAAEEAEPATPAAEPAAAEEGRNPNE